MRVSNDNGQTFGPTLKPAANGTIVVRRKNIGIFNGNLFTT
jgi:hypothetical protein